MKDPTSVLLLLLVLGTKVVPYPSDRMNQDDFSEENLAYYLTALEVLKEIGKELVEFTFQYKEGSEARRNEEQDLLHYLLEIDEFLINFRQKME